MVDTHPLAKEQVSSASSFYLTLCWSEPSNMNIMSLPAFQFSSVVQSCPTPCDPKNHIRPPSPSLTPRVRPKSMSIESVMPSNHLILCHPLLLLPPIPLASGSFQMSQLFTSGGQVLEFQFQHQSFQWTSRTALLQDGLVGSPCSPGTLKSLLQHHSSKASILRCSAFFIVQLSHPYLTTGKTIALTRWTFVGKVMSLLFNMLSRLVITFLPRNKRLLIS